MSSTETFYVENYYLIHNYIDYRLRIIENLPYFSIEVSFVPDLLPRVLVRIEKKDWLENLLILEKHKKRELSIEFYILDRPLKDISSKFVTKKIKI